MTAPTAYGADIGSDGGRRGIAPVAERGTVTIADRAVRRVAQRAAGEAVGAGGAARSATAQVRGGSTRVAVELSLPHPVDAAAVTARVQRHVTDRTEELTGLTVTRAGVLVDRLEPASASRLAPRALPAAHPDDEAAPDRAADAVATSVRRRPWSPRGVPAALLAAVVAAGCGLALFLAVVAVLDAPAVVPRWAQAVGDQAAAARLPDTAVIATAATVAVLGLWLLLLALTPGARKRRRMTSPDSDVRAVLDRRAVALLLRDTSIETRGVSGCRVRARRRRATVRATVAFGDLEATRAALTDVLNRRVRGLGLARPPRPRVRVTRAPHWRPPAHGDGDGKVDCPPRSAADTDREEP